MHAPRPSRLPSLTRIDEADLQLAGLAGRDETGRAHDAAALAVAAYRDADACDREAAAGFDRRPRRADRRRLTRGSDGACEPQQRDVGRRAMRQHGLQIELRMGCDLRDVAQLRRPLRIIFDDLVGRAALHAMRRGQRDVRRDHRARAEIAARADDGHDIAADAVRARRAAADDRVGGRCERKAAASAETAMWRSACDHRPRSSLPRAACQPIQAVVGAVGCAIVHVSGRAREKLAKPAAA